jgi:hypothetical protein
MMQLQKSDFIFNMGVEVMKPVFNLETNYRFTVLTREERTIRSPGPLLRLKGLSGLWMGPGMWRKIWLRTMGNLQTEGSVSL